MINIRIIARIFSILLLIEGLLMLATAMVAIIYGEPESEAFLKAAGITIVCGIASFTPLRREKRVYGNREGYIIIAGIWLIYSAFATLPWLLSKSDYSFVNAFFESMAGFTGTGATVIDSPATLPHVFLFWRSLTQWIGGIGIIFFSLYVLPVLRDMNIQLPTTEFTGQPGEKIHPKAVDAAKRMIGIYFLLTLAEVIMLVSGKLGFFESVCISMSTLSTGGFSTHSDSLSFVTSPFLKAVITLFMFLAATNMAIVYYGIKRNFTKIRENSEFVFYMFLVLAFSGIIFTYLWVQGGNKTSASALDVLFHVTSIVSTTGFYTTDFTLWGSFAVLMLFILMFAGGTNGSSAGGMKVCRLLIMTKNNRMELRRLIHPNAFIPVRLNRKIVKQATVYNVLVFVSLYFLVVCASSLIFSLMGYDIITSVVTSASVLANIGPGLGEFGPGNTYSSLPDSGKVFLSFLMYLGRLELMGVLILFSRSFYRK
jgi:trk system potassium uptake protein TrkH